MDIGAAVARANRAVAGFVDGPRIAHMAGVAHVQRPVAQEGQGRAPAARRHNAVEHVDSAPDGADDIGRFPDAHQIARLCERQGGHGEIERAEHQVLSLAHGKTSDRYSVERHGGKNPGGFQTQILVNPALIDSENAVAVAILERRKRPFFPAYGPFDRPFHVFVFGRVWGAFVQRHGDVGVQLALDFDRPFRGEHVTGPVDVRSEGHAIFGYFAQLGQAHNLESSAVGQNRPRPVHERVQSAHFRDQVFAGPQHQMVRVSQNDLRSRPSHVLRPHGFHGGAGPHGHERRSVYRSVRGFKRSEPGPCGGFVYGEMQHDGQHKAVDGERQYSYNPPHAPVAEW